MALTTKRLQNGTTEEQCLLKKNSSLLNVQTASNKAFILTTIYYSCQGHLADLTIALAFS